MKFLAVGRQMRGVRAVFKLPTACGQALVSVREPIFYDPVVASEWDLVVDGVATTSLVGALLRKAL